LLRDYVGAGSEPNARAIRKPYRRLLRINGRLVRQAERAAEQAQQQLRTMRGRRRRCIEKLASTIASVAAHGRQVIRQTRARVLGAQTRTPGKIVSIFDAMGADHSQREAGSTNGARGRGEGAGS
jgi:hypothetical protein